MMVYHIAEVGNCCVQTHRPIVEVQELLFHFFFISAHIGACRAVWVPGQHLATLHLMHNCGKCILSLHCMLQICLYTHMLYAGDHIFVSGPRDMSTHDSK